MRSAVNHVLALLAGLATIMAGSTPTTTRAQTITNIATIQWDVGASRIVRNSNQVDLVIEQPVPTPSTLSTYQFDGSPAAQGLSVPTTQCQGTAGTTPVLLRGAFAGLALSPASVVQTSEIHAGEPLIVAIASTPDNGNPSTADTLGIRLDIPAGDSETLVLTESGPNTGIFAGMVNTVSTSSAPVPNDCVLSIAPGASFSLASVRASNGSLIASSTVEVLIDPFGVVFDSGDGAPVAGTSVTLIDAMTGQPAQVFGDDGVSSFPAAVVTGSTVTDSSGKAYAFPPGDYRFPFVRAGTYRLIVQPPPPYTVPSTSTPAELAGLRRPDGQPFTIFSASYGGTFTLADPSPVRIDVPADRPGGTIIVRKTASISVAAPGDPVQYRITVQNGDPGRGTGAITVTDTLPAGMRLRYKSIHYNSLSIHYSISSDERILTALIPPLSGGASGTLTYILEVRPDAKPGTTINRASARDNRGAQSAVADAAVRISRDAITDRMTIIGSITDGGCTIDPKTANGLPGIRVMLDDGSYAVTDIEGRYHFEGVLPGLHVVQLDPSSLPPDQVPVDCAKNARTAGSAISRFVEGQGGSLVRADFRSATGRNSARLHADPVRRAAPPSDSRAAGADRNWFAGQMPEIGWLFPEPDHNPRTKAVRVVIKHLPGQTVTLFADGKPVDELAFEGIRKNGVESLAISQWRALEIRDGDTVFTAEVRDASGALVQTLKRTVHYANSALHAELLHAKSVLIADGVTRPVLALRMTDRAGKPVRNGLVGDFALRAPYYPAVEADAQAARQLSGLERARPVWRVEGDEGIAYVELEPTTASGGLSITLPFRDGEVTRKQIVQTWLTPGKRPWTIVGFAAGTAGFNTLNGRAEGLGTDGEHWYSDARLVLYAKGRIKGKWLMTLAYDSDKAKDEARFAGTIDPTAYYTIYADRSERRYDAASVRNLYLRLERPQFYALFGDYETGINEPQLTRYQRAFNGAKAEYGSEQVRATAFAADTPYRHRREEIQGNGLTGPYALGARDILPNSERVVIEVRDRLRSDRIVESRALVRHIDYDIDYTAGTLRFREPILSRSSLLDPQFIIVDYEVDGVGQRVLNAGGRASWTNAAKTLTLGATAIHDESDASKTEMGGVDLRFTPNPATEVRAEFAASNSAARAPATTTARGTATAWLVEAEHHGKTLDLLAYAREQQAGYGVGQTNAPENGTRKVGFDGKVRVTPDFSIVGSGWNEDYLGSAARRMAGRALAEFRTRALDLRAGLTIASDWLDDGRTASSTIAQLGASRRLFDNRLELDAQTELPIGQRSDSIDFPARHKLSARYAVTDDVTLVGGYEIAKGDVVKARMARIGFDLKPWTGGRLVASANRQSTSEYGPRSFAAYGLSQSLPIGTKLTVDFTLDGNKTLGGVDPARVLNPAHPVASGGFAGSNGVLTEDFTAVTAGATYRGTRWSVAGRAEYRDGDLGNRYGFTLSGLRQIGEGRALGGALTWFRATQKGGPRTDARAVAISWANRPDDSRFTFLEKLELREDRAHGAVFGKPGPIGGAPLTINGDATSRRIVSSFALNWSPVRKREDGTYLGRSEISGFWGTRYVFDRFGADDVKGWSNVFGADIRFDLSKIIDFGVAGTVRQNPGGRAYSWSGGPALGLSPIKNTYISAGYNVVGFHDRDFDATRYTRSGPFVTLRLKFDQHSFSALGLGAR
jgi:uncharacterized repeat protein (TIGR01451 family)